MSRMIKTSEGWKKTSGNSDQAELDNIKSSLTQVNTDLGKLKGDNVLKVFSASVNLTLTANGGGQVIVPFSRPSGYIPIMATPSGCGAWSWCWVQCVLEANNNRVNCIIKSTAEAGTYPVSVTVLCIKSDLIA